MFKIKQIVIASAILAASTSVAFANASYKGEDYKGEVAPCPTYQYVAGPYLGLSAGPVVNWSGLPAAYIGAQGTLSGGLATMLDPDFYLAGEAFVGDSWNIDNERPGHHWDFFLNNHHYGVRTSWLYGADVLPGYMITDHVLSYLRLGVDRARFKEQSKWSTGWQVGLGGQTNVCQNWDVRSEYVYTYYHKVKDGGHPNSGVFNVGVVYKFV